MITMILWSLVHWGSQNIIPLGKFENELNDNGPKTTLNFHKASCTTNAKVNSSLSKFYSPCIISKKLKIFLDAQTDEVLYGLLALLVTLGASYWKRDFFCFILVCSAIFYLHSRFSPLKPQKKIMPESEEFPIFQ